MPAVTGRLRGGDTPFRRRCVCGAEGDSYSTLFGGIAYGIITGITEGESSDTAGSVSAGADSVTDTT